MEKYSFFNAEQLPNGEYDRTYNATDWAEYFQSLINTGIAQGQGQELQVVAGNGMNVIVNTGTAYINGYRYQNTTPLNISINQANSTYTRITSVVLELNLTNRIIQVVAIDGPAGATPTAPALIKNESIVQLQLCTLLIPAGATTITNITDTRGSSETCGYLTLNAPAQQTNTVEIGQEGYTFLNANGAEVAGFTENGEGLNINQLPTFNNNQLFNGNDSTDTNGLWGPITLNGIVFYYRIYYWFFNTAPLVTNNKIPHGVGGITVTLIPSSSGDWDGIGTISLKEFEVFKGMTFVPATYHPVFAINYDESINAVTFNDQIEPYQWSSGKYEAWKTYRSTALIIG